MKKIAYILIIFAFVITKGNAQDIHFSQNQLTPLLLNPANTGEYVGNWRVSNIMRSQWRLFSKPGYQTIAIGYDQKFDDLHEGLSLGGIVVHDQSGSITMTHTKVLFSGSLKKILGRNVLYGGFQAGLVMKQFNNATYSTQFDWTTGGINPALPSGEFGIDDHISYLDMNAGLFWKRKIGWFEPEIGISFFHLNNPREKFSSYSERLRIRSMFNIGGRLIFGDKMYLHPVFYYQRLQGMENMLGGLEFRINAAQNPDRINYYTFGAWLRSGFQRQTDAAVLSFGVSVSKFLFGVSFDVNVSSLQAYTHAVGAFEIGIIYTGLTQTFNPGDLPCYRE